MLNRFRYFEPARVRAVWTALAALALALGIAIPSEADGVVTALVSALAVILPLLQGEATRAVVTPAVVAGATVEDYSDSDVEVEASELGHADPTEPALDVDELGGEYAVDDAQLDDEPGAHRIEG